MGLLDNTTPSAYYSGNDFGNYQFVSLTDIINQFMLVYVGEDKIIPKAKRLDVAFHAQRALAELSFDTFKSHKAMEITVPATLQMILPQDYVNYTKISWVDSAGIKHLLYPMGKTSNPEKYQTDTNGEYLFQADSLIPSGEMVRNGNFHGGSQHWNLNETFTSVGVTTIQALATDTTAGSPTFGDPTVGWFYGYSGNALRAYNAPGISTFQGITQTGVNIKSGEQYKVSVTASGYTSGSFVLTIIDERGDITSMNAITSNGTFLQTLTAGVTAAGQYNPSSIMFRNQATVDGNIIIDNISIVRVGDEETSTTWANYKSGTPSENQDDYIDDTYWPMNGSRYGLDPQYAQANGSFYIDDSSGKIHFSSNISGKTVVLDYISDSLGTDGEMQVHKFAEEAMYKWMAHAILAGKANIPEYQVQRFKKEKFAAVRTAKLRLSNIKLEEITQILRGKSKQIKH
jgi:hypothetical protein